ncbi:hypothetical protein [Poriferisphaera sp. WC338]|uniref:hypothetical protein n=1 Tax=Poriferisphaera sp. WC338 TaxID=3425129 RepID=UPI003D81BB97
MSRRRHAIEYMFSILLLVSFSAFIIGSLLRSFLTPYFASTDDSLIVKGTPRKFTKNHIRVTQYIGITSISISVIIFLSAYFQRKNHASWRDINPMIYAAVIFLIVGFIWIIACIPCRRFLEKRFRQTFAKRRLCFDCGYDLRGNPHATTCPECGLPCAITDDIKTPATITSTSE